MRADPDLPAFVSLGQMKDYMRRHPAYAGTALCDVTTAWVVFSAWQKRQPLVS
jgi:hypothetical protein